MKPKTYYPFKLYIPLDSSKKKKNKSVVEVLEYQFNHIFSRLLSKIMSQNQFFDDNTLILNISKDPDTYIEK